MLPDISQERAVEIEQRRRQIYPTPDINPFLKAEYEENGMFSGETFFRITRATGVDTIDREGLSPSNIMETLAFNILKYGKRMDDEYIETIEDEGTKDFLKDLKRWTIGLAKLYTNDELVEYIANDFEGLSKLKESNMKSAYEKTINSPPKINDKLYNRYWSWAHYRDTVNWFNKDVVRAIETAVGARSGKDFHIGHKPIQDVFNEIAYTLLVDSRKANIKAIEKLIENGGDIYVPMTSQDYFSGYDVSSIREVKTQFELINNWIDEMNKKFSRDEILDIVANKDVLIKSMISDSVQDEYNKYLETLRQSLLMDSGIGSNDISPELASRIAITQDGETEYQDNLMQETIRAWSILDEMLEGEISKDIDNYAKRKKRPIRNLFDISWYNHLGSKEIGTYGNVSAIKDKLKLMLPESILEALPDGALYKAADYYSLSFGYNQNNYLSVRARNIADSIILGTIPEEDRDLFADVYRALIEGYNKEFNTYTTKILGISPERAMTTGGALALAAAITLYTGGVATNALGTVGVSPAVAKAAGLFVDGATYKVLEELWRGRRASGQYRTVEEDIGSVLSYGAASMASGYALGAVSKFDKQVAIADRMRQRFIRGGLFGLGSGLYAVSDDGRPLGEKATTVAQHMTRWIEIANAWGLAGDGISLLISSTIPAVIKGTPAMYRKNINEKHADIIINNPNITRESYIAQMSEAIDKDNLVPSSVGDKVKKMLNNLEEVKPFDGGSVIINRTKTGRYVVYWTSQDTIFNVSEHYTLKGAQETAKNMLKGVKSVIFAKDAMVKITGVDVQLAAEASKKNISNIIQNVQIAINEGSDYRMPQEIIDNLVQEAKLSGVKEQTINKFLQDIGKLNSIDIVKGFSKDNKAALEYISSVKGFAKNIVNAIDNGYPIDVVRSVNKGIASSVKQAEKVLKGDTKAKPMHKDIAEALVELKKFVNDSSFDRNPETGGVIFDNKGWLSIENLRNSLKKIKEIVADRAVVNEADGEFLDKTIDTLLDRLSYIAKQREFSSDNSHHIAQVGNLLKELARENSHFYSRLDNSEFRAFSELASRQILEKHSKAKGKFFYNKLTKSFLSPMSDWRIASGEDGVIYTRLRDAQIKGQSQLGQSILYMRALSARLSREYGISAKDALRATEEVVEVPISFIFNGRNVAVGADKIKITRGNLLEIILTLQDPDGWRGITTTNSLEITTKDGKVVNMFTGLFDETKIIERKELDRTIKRLEIVKKAAVSDTEFVKAVKKAYKGREIPKELQQFIDRSGKFTVGKTGKEYQRAIDELLLVARHELNVHKDTYGWTTKEINKHYNYWEGRLEEIKDQILVALSDSSTTEDQLFNLKAAENIALENFNKNPKNNKAIANAMLKTLEEYITPEMKYNIDLWYNSMANNSEALSIASYNATGISIPTTKQYFPISRKTVSGVPKGNVRSIIHSQITKPRHAKTSETMLFGNFTDTFADNFVESAFLAGAYEDLYPVEQFLYSHEYQELLKKITKDDNFYNLVGDLADDLARFGRQPEISGNAKPFVAGIRTWMGMPMSNANVFVALGQLSSIPMATLSDIDMKYLLDPRNSKYYTESMRILFNDGYTAARWHTGSFYSMSHNSNLEAMLSGGGSTATIRIADFSAIANIFTASRRQAVDLGVGSSMSDPKVIKYALRKTQEATMFTQPSWTSFSRPEIANNVLTYIAQNPFRGARDIAVNAAIVKIIEGEPYKAIGAYMASQIWYSGNRVLKNAVSHDLRMFINSKRDVFPEEHLDYIENSYQELGRAMAGTLPFGEELYNALDGLYNIATSNPTGARTRDFLANNTFERAFNQPAKDLARGLRDWNKYWKLKENIDNVIVYNIETDKFDILSPSGVVVSSTKDPSAFLMKNFDADKVDILLAMKDEGLKEVMKVFLTAAQYTALYAFRQPTLAYAIGEANYFVPIQEENSIFNNDVYTYAKKEYNLSRSNTRELMIKTVDEYNDLVRRLNKIVPPSQTRFIMNKDKEMTEEDVATTVKRYMEAYDSPFIIANMRVIKKELQRLHMSKIFGNEHDRQDFNKLQDQYIDFIKKLSDNIKMYNDVLDRKGDGEYYKVVRGRSFYKMEQVKEYK